MQAISYSLSAQLFKPFMYFSKDKALSFVALFSLRNNYGGIYRVFLQKLGELELKTLKHIFLGEIIAFEMGLRAQNVFSLSSVPLMN